LTTFRIAFRDSTLRIINVSERDIFQGKKVITGYQLRAARSFLRWSAEETASRVGITKKTIERLEQHEGVPSTRAQTLLDLQRAFESAGIEFVGTPEEGPGVRLWRDRAK